ncbi:glycerate kinase [Caldanaerobius fijiensis DSM 17918]|uniref:Glycerate kinase n=1 Tax=Caldanaerobius fijiensis DSM 17918 TaxID=1121256 RepID=A0A1M5DLQ5_9THEO|nr:glycerate kinase [Caldanaerobius fijiensis]SHF67702.1 glycerate kinase [Caldanaerobius fijiensis DSM 17918]
MKIIVAPDSFKGNMTSYEVACHIEKGIKRVFSDADVVILPMADGGEGTVEALVKATNGEIISLDVTGPQRDRVKGFYGILGDGQTAVVEIAAASGLPLVPEDKLNPETATSYGTGELIKDALNRGIKKLIIGLGGSATNDGGAGIVQALGVKLLDERGNSIELGGIHLKDLCHIDVSGLDERIKDVEILVACDVDNPLCGPRGASAVYGPQKGATPEMVRRLDSALAHFADVIKAELGVDVLNMPGAGAAGGAGAGLVAFLGARLLPGIKLVCDAVNLDRHLENADLVITGEGKIDGQTIHGKTPVGVASYAKKHGVPVFAIGGMLGEGYEVLHDYGIDALFDINPRTMTLSESIKESSENLEKTTEEIMRAIALFYKK